MQSPLHKRYSVRYQMYGWIVPSRLLQSSSCDVKRWVGARSRGLGLILILKGLWKSYCPYQVYQPLKVTKKSQTGSQIDFSKVISGEGVLDSGGLSLKSTLRTSLVVQWLRLHASNAGGMGQLLVRELRSHMQPKKKKKKDFWVPFLNPAVTIIVQKHLLATHSLADTVIFDKGFTFIRCLYGNCWTEIITKPSAWPRISFKQIHFNSPS